ncbi:hypothetical protein HBB16_10905 [Pseudonocardia sp. MCCB 268]|nr:hypothetical protein [Pseudonocardia cytotoxica]
MATELNEPARGVAGYRRVPGDPAAATANVLAGCGPRTSTRAGRHGRALGGRAPGPARRGDLRAGPGPRHGRALAPVAGLARGGPRTSVTARSRLPRRGPAAARS